MVKKYKMDRAIHSDILIHWTGKKVRGSKQEKVDQYLKLLRNILEYGLWMTEDNVPEQMFINRQIFKKPIVARTCFTELRLSESQEHARLYGPLGIGVKRYFLFDRLGSPMFYAQNNTRNLFFPPFSNVYMKKTDKNHISSFFKQMCIVTPKDYAYYNESEWRIIYSEPIQRMLIKNNLREITKLFINPLKEKNRKYYDYYKKLRVKKKPKYLMPLDPWLAIIIYPDLETKKRAVEDTEIRKLLREISHKPTITGCPEKGHFPIELNLAACRNF